MEIRVPWFQSNARNEHIKARLDAESILDRAIRRGKIGRDGSRFIHPDRGELFVFRGNKGWMLTDTID